ncbi:MAG: glycosyltransferase family 2 protein [Dehalococcoidia bacterium]|nr:glycosyltransferase family 2 protein [Dehalococcoidia bacterium]
MSPQPEVSVVIPAYNAGEFIAEAIQSVLAAPGPTREVIVVDDGSTDNTASIAAGFSEVRLLQRPNGGIGAARNTALMNVSAPLVAFLDADDVWPLGRLTALVSALVSGVDAAFGQIVQFGDGREESEPAPALLAGTMLIRTEAAARAGKFREDVKVGEFIDWWSRAEEAGVRRVQIPDVVLRRRIHTSNTGITHAGSRVDYARVLRAALERRRGSN